MPTKPLPKELTQAAFAVRVQLSRRQVGRLVADGVLPTTKEGRIPRVAGEQALKKHRAAQKPLPPALDVTKQALQEAQIRVANARAEQRELELARERGLVVPVAAVEVDAREVAERIRTVLLGIGARVALHLEALCASRAPRAAEVQRVVDEEVNQALTALNERRFGRDDAPTLDAPAAGPESP